MSGRAATTRVQAGDFALSVGCPNKQAPTGWQWVELNKLAEMATGHTPKRSHPEYWGGNIKWMCAADARFNHGGVVYDTAEKINQLGIDNSAAVVLPKDTVCLSRSGSIGYVVRLGEPMATNQGFVNWICGQELDPKYYQYILVAEKKFLLRIAYGAAHHTIYYPELKAFHICAPPLNEQKRVVAILDEAFAGIDLAIANTKKNITNVRELFESYLNSIFTTRRDGWIEKQLSDVCSITSKLIDPRDDEFIDLQHVGAGNIISMTGELIRVQTARDEGLKSGKFVFDEKMVLYSKIRPYLMKVVRPDFSGLCSADIYPLKPNIDFLDRDFLYYLLLSKQFTEYAIAGSDRAGMPKVNRDHLFQYSVALPGVSEQKRISEQLDAIGVESHRLEAIYQQKLSSLKELKQSLLQKAFSGELTAEDDQLKEEAVA